MKFHMSWETKKNRWFVDNGCPMRLKPAWATGRLASTLGGSFTELYWLGFRFLRQTNNELTTLAETCIHG